MRKFLVASALIAGSILFPTTAWASSTEAHVDVILDESGFFSSAEEQRLTDGFAEVAEVYGILPVVEVVQSLGGEDPQRYAVRRANDLGIGDAEADNGLYVLVSIEDRELRVEPGLGLARVVTKGEIQRAIDDTFLPNFKKGDYVTGIEAGVQEIGEYSLKDEAVAPPAAPSAPIDLTPLWIVLGSLGGLAVVGAGVGIGLSARAKAKRKAETERQRKVAESVEVTLKRFADSPDAVADFKAAPTEAARYDRIEQKLKDVPFSSNAERLTHLKRIERQLASKLVSYSGIDPSYFRSSLSSDESVQSFADRLLAEVPKAKVKLQEAIEAERIRKEEERQRALRRKEAQEKWNRLSDSEKERFALSDGTERKKLGARLFADYGDRDKASFYGSFADSFENDLKSNAKRAFDRLPRYERERIARASSYQREQYLQQYIPGYNPALAAIYIASSSSFLSTLHAEEARAASSSSSSSSSSSFSSFDSGSSFSGGSFDGGGGGGSW